MDAITMYLDGYKHGAPTLEAEAIDMEVVASMKCRRCGGRCTYDGWHTSGSYVAMAICQECGHEEEF